MNLSRSWLHHQQTWPTHSDHMEQFQLSLLLIPILEASHNSLRLNRSVKRLVYSDNEYQIPYLFEFGQHTRNTVEISGKTKGFTAILDIYSVFLTDQYLNFFKDMPWPHILVKTGLFLMLKNLKRSKYPLLLLWHPGYSINQRAFSRTLNLKAETQRHETVREQEFMVLAVDMT